MQISNPVISQTISQSSNSSVKRTQQADRLPLKPVTIEGRLENEKQRTGNTTQNYSDLQQTENTIAGQLITPASAPQNAPTTGSENFTSSLLQKQINARPDLASNSGSISVVQNFSYGSRRSFAGLSGASLVIQKYLNNESPLTAQQNSTGNIDLFI